MFVLVLSRGQAVAMTLSAAYVDVRVAEADFLINNNNNTNNEY